MEDEWKGKWCQWDGSSLKWLVFFTHCFIAASCTLTGLVSLSTDTDMGKEKVWPSPYKLYQYFFWHKIIVLNISSTNAMNTAAKRKINLGWIVRNKKNCFVGIGKKCVFLCYVYFVLKFVSNIGTSPLTAVASSFFVWFRNNTKLCFCVLRMGLD